MTKLVFKNQTGKSPELFPVNIFDRIPDNHPVRLVDSVEKYKEKLKAKIGSVLSDIESRIQSDNRETNKDELPLKINSEELREKLAA